VFFHFFIFVFQISASYDKKAILSMYKIQRMEFANLYFILINHYGKLHQSFRKWEIILCDFCGSSGSHVACGYLKKLGKRNVCPECYNLDQKCEPLLLFVRIPDSLLAMNILFQTQRQKVIKLQ